jgi:PAS domain S-box-containing protein
MHAGSDTPPGSADAFEALLAEMSDAFHGALPASIDDVIPVWLRRLVEFLDVDRASVGRFRPDGTIEVTHFWCRPGIDSPPEIGPFRWYTKEIRRGRTLALPRLPEGLPDEALAEREYVHDSGFRAHLAIPLYVAGESVAQLGFGAFRFPRPWPPEVIRRMRIVGDLIAGSLFRKKTSEALARSEARLRQVLESAPDTLLLVRPDGSVSFANGAAVRAFGYSRTEVLDMPLELLVPALDAPVRDAARKHPGALAEIPNLVGRRRDGREFPVEIRLTRVGAAEGELVCFLRDPSEDRELGAIPGDLR